jgi:magnesium transporter
MTTPACRRREGVIPMLRGYYRAPDGTLTAVADAGAVRQALAEPEGLLWLDLESPLPEEAGVLSDVFDFHPLTIEDCLTARLDPPKIDDYGHYLFVVVHGVEEYVGGRELEPMELDLYLGANYVVSCHLAPVAAVRHTLERCQRGGPVLEHDAGFLLHTLLDGLVDDMMPMVDELDETVDRLEEQVLADPQRATLQEILLVRRNTIRLRRFTTAEREIANRLSRGEFPALVREEAHIYFRDVYDHLVRIEYLVESVRDLADGALNTYLSVVSNRLNEVMKVLTAAAAIFLPLALIPAVYGMNFTDKTWPPWDEGWSFGLVVGAMVALGAMLAFFFRRRGWI